MKNTLLIVFALLISCGNSCLADVRLPKILGSNMVLQRNAEVKIWGWAEAGEQIRVTCSWLDLQARVEANANGQWHVRVKTGTAGGPHTIAISGKNSVTLEQILFGEVWIGSGQSNMEMPLVSLSGAYTGIKDAAQEVASANYPKIRLFQVGNFSSKQPLDDVESGISMYGIPPSKCEWQACTPETIPNFASTAYFFARHLHKELEVPIGIIDASWGGTGAEAWTPRAGLEALGYASELQLADTRPQQAAVKTPTRLYNGMIHPLRNVRIKGVVWYQGEQNGSRADRYHKLFATMIDQWRASFQHEFPFYFAQIAPHNQREFNSAYLREAQFETMAGTNAGSVPKTGMAVTLDIGNLTDVHPKNKQEVGRRLALWALAKDYGRDVEYSGPVYKECAFENGEARLSFDHIGGGLVTRDGQPPSDFEVASSDETFHSARAEIVGKQVVVHCDEVTDPKSVRYAFKSNATPNLMNREGLPASSFRTDRW